MAVTERTVDRLNIELGIKESDQNRQAIQGITSSLSNVSKAAKSVMKDNAEAMTKGFDDTSAAIRDMAKELGKAVKSGADADRVMQAFENNAKTAMKELEKSSDRIAYSLSEQGKAERELLAQKKEQLEVLKREGAEQKEIKKLQSEIKSLQKNVVEGSDEELSTALKRNQALRVQIQLTGEQARREIESARRNQSMLKYAKDDLKALKERLKEQFKFINALKTTEGRYNAIKKAAKAAFKAAPAVAKGTIKGAGMLAGAAMAAGGMAVASANDFVQREEQARRIKGGFTDDEKQEILGGLYIKTGQGYDVIVEAIGRVQSLLGASISKDELLKATEAELRMPGASQLFQTQTGSTSSDELVQYVNRMRAVQGATGASVADITSSSQYVSNLRDFAYRGGANQTDLQALYLALKGSGGFDDDSQIQKAMTRFLRAQGNSGKNLFDFAQTYDWSRGVYGTAAKNQSDAVKRIDWLALSTASNAGGTTLQQSDAEKTAMSLRKMEEEKNKLLMKLIPAVKPIIEALAKFLQGPEAQGIIETLIDTIGTVLPPVLDLLNLILEMAKPILRALKPVASMLGDAVAGLADLVKKFTSDSDRPVSGGARANGGLAMMPSICGEAGPEIVLPLSYTRQGRAQNISDKYNLSQVINMSPSSSQTAYSLTAAVNSRGFARALASSVRSNNRTGGNLNG